MQIRRLLVLLGILAVAVFAAAICASAQRFSQWSEPVNLGPNVNPNLLNVAQYFPSISKDGLSLYFTASPLHPDSLGGTDIYVCRRATVDDAWGPAQNLGPNVNTPYDEGAPFVSIDGHRLYFQSNRIGGFGGGDLYVSRRHDKDDDFGWEPAENLGSGVNTSANEAGPSVYEDETGATIMYFASDRFGGPGPGSSIGGFSGQQGSDIYMSTLQPDGTFGSATLIDELSTTSIERRPYVNRDGLEMFLTSDRPGTLGGLDIWVSTRESTSDPWSPPVNLGLPVNSASNDAGAAISFDGTALYFQTVRSGNFSSGYNLWVATRTKLTGPPQ